MKCIFHIEKCEHILICSYTLVFTIYDDKCWGCFLNKISCYLLPLHCMQI